MTNRRDSKEIEENNLQQINFHKEDVPWPLIKQIRGLHCHRIFDWKNNKKCILIFIWKIKRICFYSIPRKNYKSQN